MLAERLNALKNIALAILMEGNVVNIVDVLDAKIPEKIITKEEI